MRSLPARLARFRGAGAVFMAAVLAGCYTYHVLPVERVAPGQDVRMRISAAEAEKLGEIIGRDDRVLDGRLLEAGEGPVVVGVSSVSHATALTAVPDLEGQLVQRVAVPRDALLELEVRRLDRTRTGIVVGLLAAATTAVAISQFNHQSAINEKGKGGAQAARIPLFFPLPLGR